jgi:multidrug efflux pump subunit AcrA (membrane-fusion protein)
MNVFKIFDFFKKRKKTTLVLVVFLIIVGFFVRRALAGSSGKPSYQTETVQKGTLVSSISASGVIAVGGTTDITTSASGVVKKVYVKNGETVTKGQKLAELTLDDEAQSRQTIAYAAYIDAVNAEKTAQTNKITADVQMWKDRQAIFEALDDQDYKNNNTVNPDTKEEYTDSEKAIVDKIVEQKRKAFEASETAYKNADSQINKAKAQISSAWRNYQKASSIITAPVAGVVSNFSLSPGLTIVASSASISSSPEGNNNGSISPQKIGSISQANAQYQAVVNLSEVDVTKVNPDQKVTLTLDAFPEKTFTGKVLSIDTTGRVSSGVTTYPTTILLDSTKIKIYPNMSVTANIIIDSKADVLLVPNSAIQNQDGQIVVRVLNKDQLEFIPVEIGLASETQTEIVSGLSEGTAAVTAVTNSSKASSTTASPFGTMRMGGMGGGTSRQQIRIEK